MKNQAGQLRRRVAPNKAHSSIFCVAAALLLSACCCQFACAQEEEEGTKPPSDAEKAAELFREDLRIGGRLSTTEDTKEEVGVVDSVEKRKGVQGALSDARVGHYEEAYKTLRALRLKYPRDRKLTSRMFEIMAGELKRIRNTRDKDRLHSRYLEMAGLARAYIQGTKTKPKVRKSMSQALINEAVVYGMQNETEKCLESLKLASTWGFEDIRQLYLLSEFNSVRDAAGFKEIFGDKITVFENEILDYARKAIEQSQPYEFSLQGKTITGKDIDLTKFRGKLLLIDLCGSLSSASDKVSRVNIPMLQELSKKHADNGVQVVGIRFEKNQLKPIEAIKKFVEKHSIEYPMIEGRPEFAQKVKGLKVLPSLMIIDSKGKVRTVLTGGIPMVTLEAFIKLHISGEIDELVWQEPSTNNDVEANDTKASDK